MAVEFVDWLEAKGFAYFGDIPNGALVQFSDEKHIYCGVKTVSPMNSRIPAMLIIGGELNGILIDGNSLGKGPFINIGDIANIVIEDPSWVPSPAISAAPVQGCAYKDLSAQGVLYMWGTMVVSNGKDHYWVCLESSNPSIKRGDSFHALKMDDFLPISTKLEVRRRDWRD